LPEPYEMQGETIGVDLLRVAGVDFDRSDALTQALIGTFLFGMLLAHAMSFGRTPEEARNLAISVFESVLHYTPAAASEGVQHCIEATRPGVHDTMNAILHRGIDGHRQYIERDEAGLERNVRSVLEHFRN
jgi:hypothetical protein